MSSSHGERASGIALWGALAVPWLFIWQGLDLTDQGYVLTSYRCFFKQPEAIEDTGSTWLTNLFGAIWDAIFGGLGVVGMRALWAFSLSLGLFLSFRLVARVTNTRAAAFATLAVSVFLTDRRETWFSYNTSSSLMFVAAVACLLYGMSEKSRGRLLGAGVLIGALPFARVPNVLAAALLATPIVAALVYAERRARLRRELATLALGALAGGVGTLGLIYVLGHSQYFFASIAALFAPAARQSGYGGDELLANFIKDQGSALAWGLAVSVAGAVLAQLFSRLPNVVAWLLAVLLAALGAFGLAGTDELWRFVVPGTGYWLLAGFALGLGRCSFEQRTLAFMALVILVVAPLGSNNGIKNAHMGLWLALPLVLALIASVDVKWLAHQGPKLAVIGCIVLAGEGLHRAATYTYRDSQRSTLLAKVPHPQLRAQLTSPARAKVVGEVLNELERRVAPGDYLLAYEGTPLLHYLTKTRPYLSRAWLMGALTADEVARLADETPMRTGCLPVAVLARKSTRNFDWPMQTRRLEGRQPQRGVRQVLTRFLRAHSYKRQWTNGFFEILAPPAAGARSCR